MPIKAIRDWGRGHYNWTYNIEIPNGLDEMLMNQGILSKADAAHYHQA